MAPRTVTCALLAAVTGSCAGNSANQPSTTDDPSPGSCSGGGLPTPTCGKGECGCCVGCSLKDGLCFGTGWRFVLGVGQCVAPPAAGTLQVDIGTSRFVAEQVAAIVDDAYLEISARVADRTLVLQLPAVLGDGSCATSTYLGEFAYYQGALELRNRPALPTRPDCTVSLTKVGNVGERIEGSFSATVATSAGPTTITLSNGTFSVERTAFP
jgi:hypothetical protein